MPHSGATPHSPGEPGRYELILEHIPQLVWVAGPDGALQYLNRYTRDYSGLPIDDLLGWDWGWIVHPADLPNTLSIWNECLRTGSPVDLEFRLRRHDGEYRWFGSKADPMRDADGKIIRWYGVCHDIEDIKQANIKLRGTHRLFKALIERNPRGFALIAADSTVRYLSPACAKIMGHRPEDRVGSGGFENSHPDDRTLLTRWHAHLLAHPGEEIEFQCRFLHQDKSYQRLWVHAVNLLPDPDVRAIVVSFWDAEKPRAEQPNTDI